MAAAEARAAWQRTANRCFVQEDARRAPKLTCCSSSVGSSSKSQTDGQITGSENTSDHHEPPRMDHGLNPNKCDDLKWWLHIQPCFRHEKDFEQVNATEQHELESSDVDDSATTTTKAGIKIIPDFYTFQTACVNCVKNGCDAKMHEIKADNNNCSENSTTDREKDEDFNDSEHEKPFLVRPWWRTADGDELASLVAQKSLDVVENCDLPKPQKRFWNGSSLCVQKDEFSILSDWESSGSTRSNENQSTVSGLGCSLNLPAKPLREQASSEQPIFNTDPDRSRLLEALCHSQTRARKAEKAAQQLSSQKQHVVKLFLKQASELFAYKQWLHLLHIQNVCLQLKSKDQSFPWLIPRKPEKKKKKGRRAGKSVLALALGLGLVGAGLILGWTMGWLLPAISMKMRSQSETDITCK